MKRPCLDCGALIAKGSRCPRCKRAYRSTSDQKTFRRRVIKELGPACVICGSTIDVHAHHLHPIGEGGDKRGPGVPLCRRCHRLLHRET